MDELLKQQLEMYERGDIDGLEQILSSTMSQLPQDNEDLTIISEAVTVTPSLETDPSIADSSNASNNNNNNTQYPALTDEVKQDISRVTKEWIRLDEGLTRIRKMKVEIEKERKEKSKQLLDFIETYGLKDITKGKHQLVPRIKKGGKKGFNKRSIQEQLVDFLGTLEIVDGDIEEIALQATDYLDNTRGVCADVVELKHHRL